MKGRMLGRVNKSERNPEGAAPTYTAADVICPKKKKKTYDDQ